jgi:Cu+-exporting ATPase
VSTEAEFGAPARARDDALYDEGLAHSQAGDWTAALRCFEALAERYPGDPDAARMLEQARFKARLDQQTRVKPAGGLRINWGRVLTRALLVVAIIVVGYFVIMFAQKNILPAIQAQRAADAFAALVNNCGEAAKGVDTAALDAAAAGQEAAGRSVSWLARAGDRRALGLLAFGDAVKAGAAAGVARLSARGFATVMLTGDNRGAAQAAATALGIDRVLAEVLPGDKAAQVGSLKSTGKTVAMVGDGVNDAPALAAADIGIAMSSGSDVAMHTAGITLMRGDPALVADAIDISRRTYAKIRQNLFWAFAYNVVGIPLAAAGLLSPVIAGAAMAFSSVSVVTNALTLKRWKPEGK